MNHDISPARGVTQTRDKSTPPPFGGCAATADPDHETHAPRAAGTNRREFCAGKSRDGKVVVATKGRSVARPEESSRVVDFVRGVSLNNANILIISRYRSSLDTSLADGVLLSTLRKG